MWTVHCVNNMVVFRYFSFSNHHEKWPWSKTTIINSNPLYLNCTLWVAKKCWVAKLFCEMRIFLRTVQHLLQFTVRSEVHNADPWFSWTYMPPWHLRSPLSHVPVKERLVPSMKTVSLTRSEEWQLLRNVDNFAKTQRQGYEQGYEICLSCDFIYFHKQKKNQLNSLE